MGEERNPLLGGDLIRTSAAYEFVRTVGQANHEGLAELLKDAAVEGLLSRVI